MERRSPQSSKHAVVAAGRAVAVAGGIQTHAHSVDDWWKAREQTGGGASTEVASTRNEDAGVGVATDSWGRCEGARVRGRMAGRSGNAASSQAPNC
jgi:hypothetical protein